MAVGTLRLIDRGTFQASVVAYASEITPVPLRGFLTVSSPVCNVNLVAHGPDLRQSMLDHRTVPCRWSLEGNGQSYRRVGLPDPICNPMDLAHSPDRPHPLCARVALVSRPSWSTGRSGSFGFSDSEERIQGRSDGCGGDDGENQ